MYLGTVSQCTTSGVTPTMQVQASAALYLGEHDGKVGCGESISSRPKLLEHIWEEKGAKQSGQRKAEVPRDPDRLVKRSGGGRTPRPAVHPPVLSTLHCRSRFTTARPTNSFPSSFLRNPWKHNSHSMPPRSKLCQAQRPIDTSLIQCNNNKNPYRVRKLD